MESPSQNWLTEIKPADKKIKINFKEIWKYRDLIGLFVKRDFTAKYKQTVLGPAWAVVQPLLTTIVFSIIFGSLAKLTTSDIKGNTIEVPAFLFYMTGTVMWSYFSGVVSATSSTFISNSAIMGKVYFPRMVTPISVALSNLISFFIQSALFVLLLAVFIIIGIAEIRFSLFILMIPILIIQMMMLAVGTGIIVSSLTTKYRDLNMLVGFGLQLWEYISPIPYGLALIPDKYMWLYMLNPMTPIITTMRFAVFGTGFFSLFYYLISVAVTVIVFFIGMIMFNRIERTFADTV